MRASTTSSSLELLLDTICNTFGGVLFLAILVCVLLKNTVVTPAPTTRQVSAQELAALERKSAELTIELESTLRATAQQRRLMAQFTAPEQADILASFAAASESRDIAVARRVELSGKVLDTRRRIKQIHDELRQLDEQVELAQKARATTEEALQAEIESRTQRGALPRVRPSIKLEVGLVLRFGRIYLWHEYGLNGQRLGLNRDDFVVVEETPDGLVTAPKPYRGLPVTNDEQFNAALARLLDKFDNAEHYLAVLVWPDSFELFEILKRRLVESHFEYRLMPMPWGDSVIDQGGTGGMVQ